jgi:hypothetical protein
VLFKTVDKGLNWKAISPDLTRHDTTKMGQSGVPYTNEGAGGENYATIAYVTESAHEKGVIWTGSDDGIVSLTRDEGKTWNNVTPNGLKETLINSIEVSPHDKATAYIATTRYKVNDFTPAIYKTTDYGRSWTNISKGIPYGAYTRTVREDDVKKDLLYAGTETGFYISYNGGKTWKGLQLNLPVTPITDIKVHKGNLIASTMGRGFWILDDLTVLRQFNHDAGARFEVFKPSDAYRVSGGSVLDVVDDEEDSPPPVYSSGTNPPTGVSLYYFLPEKLDSVKLTLHILDEKGQVVRNYATEADKKFVKFPGGPDADPILPYKTGLNRFVWDMRYATLPGVPNVFIEGSYQGRKVAPGKYTATFKWGKEEKTTPITILSDPRITATTAEYLSQQQTLAEVDAAIKEMHHAVNGIRIGRNQVTSLLELLTDTVKYKPVLENGRKLAKKITAWEEKVVQPKAQSNDDIINFVNMLSADYIFLKGEMDVNIPAVTTGQQQRLAELNGLWRPLKNEYEQIQKDIGEFNALCRSLGIEKITLPQMVN